MGAVQKHAPARFGNTANVDLLLKRDFSMYDRPALPIIHHVDYDALGHVPETGMVEERVKWRLAAILALRSIDGRRRLLVPRVVGENLALEVGHRIGMLGEE